MNTVLSGIWALQTEEEKLASGFSRWKEPGLGNDLQMEESTSHLGTLALFRRIGHGKYLYVFLGLSLGKKLPTRSVKGSWVWAETVCPKAKAGWGQTEEVTHHAEPRGQVPSRVLLCLTVSFVVSLKGWRLQLLYFKISIFYGCLINPSVFSSPSTPAFCLGIKTVSIQFTLMLNVIWKNAYLAIQAGYFLHTDKINCNGIL